MPRNKFINPANGHTYEWHRNHESEDAAGKTRAITGTANTGNVGRVRQQGMADPYERRLKGRIVHRAQFIEFWTWFQLCDTQTIVFEDHEGFQYEGQITAFTPRIVRKEYSPTPDPGMPRHFYEYDMSFQVYRFISGDMAAAGVVA
jgi:hypothetical protein